MAVAFDTLKYAETLHCSGLPEEQAKALPDALKEGMGSLSTKEDLAGAKRDLKTDISEVKQEIKADILALEQKLKADIADIRRDIKLLRWMAGFQMALIVAVLWLLVRLVTATG